MGFGGPQANVSTGGVRGRGSALPVLGNRCLAEITVPYISSVAEVSILFLENAFAACAEPTPDNQYTTFKPTLRLTRSRFACVFAACAEPTPHHQYTTLEPTHLHQISFSHMRLPLMRNHLLTTSTIGLKLGF